MKIEYSKCNCCSEELKHTFVDLGMAPMVSAYLEKEQLTSMEPFYPLHAYVCGNCFLVQLPQAQTPDQIFSDYPYFSSVSSSWLSHAENYSEMISGKISLTTDSKVMEVASNDGYLLQYFKKKGTSVLGIEPAKNIAQAAVEKGIPTVSEFFGAATATQVVEEYGHADLLIGNNVLAHVPDLNDFVKGLSILLGETGMITVEFPHLLRTMLENQFDQVFHEHFSYLSLLVVKSLFASHGLQVVDVDTLSTHGGSIRVHARHQGGDFSVSGAVEDVLQQEILAGLDKIDTYLNFSKQASEIKHKLLGLLIPLVERGESIVGYGAPGKGCVMLNYVGIRADLLDYLVDKSPAKQDKYMPGVHLPILDPETIRETQPRYVLILAWNLAPEIMKQMDYIRAWGGKFIVPIPEPKILE